jgi:cytochrome c553
MQLFIKEAKMVKIATTLLLAIALSGCGGSSKKSDQEPQESSAKGVIKVTKNAVKIEEKNSTSKENSGEFYYSYNKKNDKETKKYNSETSKVRTTIDAYLNIKSPYEKVRITLMVKRLSKEYIVKCSPCHDDYANGVIGPSLLDKDGEFIYQRIIDFKTGKRENALMKELVEQIDDAKLKELALEIANFNKEIRKMREGK